MPGAPKVYLECKFDEMYLDWGIKIGKTRSTIKNASSYKNVTWIDWIIVCVLQFLSVLILVLQTPISDYLDFFWQTGYILEFPLSLSATMIGGNF